MALFRAKDGATSPLVFERWHMAAPPTGEPLSDQDHAQESAHYRHVRDAMVAAAGLKGRPYDLHVVGPGYQPQ